MEPRPDQSPLVVIVGETASGKSALALKLAEYFNGEIICADSRTIYKGLDIGTAKPSAEGRLRIPHHLLDVVEPGEHFSAGEFKRLAATAIEDISSRGKLPIMAGGTGLYVDALLYDFSFAPVNASRDPVNPRHLSREVAKSRHPLRARTLVLGLSVDREALRRRIFDRVEAMVSNGLIAEVQVLGRRYGWDAPAAKAPAYKSLQPYVKGQVGFEEAKALFVRYDMDLAKKQRTWFKRNKDIHWISELDEAVDLITTFLSK